MRWNPHGGDRAGGGHRTRSDRCRQAGTTQDEDSDGNVIASRMSPLQTVAPIIPRPSSPAPSFEHLARERVALAKELELADEAWLEASQRLEQAA